MPVFVDALLDHGWTMRGNRIENSHLFADSLDELHRFAASLALRRAWFQYAPGKLPHYDLTPGKHWQAIRAGAQLLDRAEAVAKWREIKAADAARLDAIARGLASTRAALDTPTLSQMSTALPLFDPTPRA